MTAHAERSAGDGWTVERITEGGIVIRDQDKTICAVVLGERVDPDVALEIAHQMAAAPLLVEALVAFAEARQHAMDGTCGCDDDCDAALDLWRTADRLVDAALTAARVPDEREVGDE